MSGFKKKNAASTFIVCPHKPLKQMSGPPIEIYLEDDAKPCAFCTQTQAPVFGKSRLKQISSEMRS